jgi:hypothetical protein
LTYLLQCVAFWILIQFLLKQEQKRFSTSICSLFSTECMDWWIYSWDKHRHIGIQQQSRTSCVFATGSIIRKWMASWQVEDPLNQGFLLADKQCINFWECSLGSNHCIVVVVQKQEKIAKIQGVVLINCKCTAVPVLLLWSKILKLLSSWASSELTNLLWRSCSSSPVEQLLNYKLCSKNHKINTMHWFPRG